MGKEYKWHRLKEELPQNEEHYLVCDERGRITIKYWSFAREVGEYAENKCIFKTLRPDCFLNSNAYLAEPATNVCYWTELPDVPIEVEDKAKEEAIERKIKELQKELAELQAAAVIEESVV